MNTEIDLRTPLQREKDKRNARILSDFRFLMANPPENSTKWAILRALGEKYGLKAQGVRQIIEKMEHTL